MKSLFVATTALALVACWLLASSPASPDAFNAWKAQFNQQFTAVEDIYRKVNFEKTLVEIEQHNSRVDATYQKGINQFAHLTDQEFVMAYMTPSADTHLKVESDESALINADIDWVIAGKVSPVKNQGSCDAGYAFSTTGLIESYVRIHNNATTTYSDQQLVDCSGSYGTQGCSGGSRTGALNYVKDKGIAVESTYPYKGVAGTCKTDIGTFKLASYYSATGCTDIAAALVNGPVTIAADATNWRTYRSGIFSDCTTKVTHDILLVGVNNAYWKIKNSWGLSWGEYGYIRLAPGNTCGICGITAYGIK